MTLRVRLLTYLIGECYRSGQIDSANSSCRSMMPYWSSIRSDEKMRLSLEYRPLYGFLLHLKVEESSLLLTE